MNIRTTHLFQAVHDAVLTSEGGLTFGQILAQIGDVVDPFTLAQLIEVDGRTRMMIGAPVILRDYLEASSLVASERVALDAAIDMTLRHRRRHSRGSEGVVEALVSEYPEHVEAIREADLIDSVLCSTESMLHGPSRYREELPCEFGPLIDSGARCRYRLMRFLGSGAYGEVYLAVDRQFADDDHPAQVAIKVMHSIHASEAARREFLDEATKARRIRHPNVVQVLDRGITRDGHDYIVYEFVDSHGAELATLARAWAVRDAVLFVAQLAEAVQTIHAAGLIHCDIKPGNILVGSRGEPKITDFGVAVRSSTARGQVERYDASGPVGTIGFMAPEQYRGEEDALRAAADVYAVGGILYWLLTGEVPNGPTGDAIARNLAGPAARVMAPDLGSKFDSTLRAVCARALAPDPQDRYPAAAMLAADLRLWLERRPIPWVRTPMWRVGAMWARRNPVATVFLCFAMLGAGLGVWQGKIAYEQAIVRRKIAPLMTFLRMTMATNRNTGFDAQQFTTIWTWEWLFGPEFLDEPQAARALWSKRIEIIEERIAANRAAGAADHLETFNFDMALAFWQVQDGLWEGIEARLTELEAVWSKRLPAGDRYLETLRLIRDRAAVNRLAADPASATPEELEAIAQRLEAYVALDDAASADGGPMALLAYRTGKRLYGPTLLNRVVDRDRHRANEKRFLDSDRFVPEEGEEDEPVETPGGP